MGLFDFFKKTEKSDLENYYAQRNNVNNTAYNPSESYPQNYTQPMNQGYAQPVPQNNMYPLQNNAFYMVIEDVFTITGRGTVVTGRVKTGTVSVGDVINLQHSGMNIQVQVVGLEQFRKKLNFAKEGDYVGVLLSGITKADVNRGDILTK